MLGVWFGWQEVGRGHGDLGIIVARGETAARTSGEIDHEIRIAGSDPLDDPCGGESGYRTFVQVWLGLRIRALVMMVFDMTFPACLIAPTIT